MARYEQLAFVELSFKFFISKNYHQGIKVIEIGSYDVNGSVRKNFPSCHYTGIDLINGPGVDIVSSGESVDLPDDTYDVAISCECFEHNQSWRGTFINMHRMTKPGGLMIITCASRGRTEHGTERTTPSDSPGTQFAGNAYYRNLNVRDFKTSFNLAGMFRHYQFFYNGISKDLYFCGWKKAGASLFEGNYDEFAKAVKELSPPRKGITSIMYNLPLTAASHIFPDYYFQNFQKFYKKLLAPLKNKQDAPSDRATKV